MNIVSVFRAKPPHQEGWRRAHSYSMMVLREKGFEAQTNYKDHWDDNQGHGFGYEFGRFFQVLGQLKISLADKQALIVGPDKKLMEARILLQTAPDLKQVHVVDWNEQLIEKAEEAATLETADHTLSKLILHLSDAVNMEGITEPGSIQIAYMHQVIEHIEGWDGMYPQVIPQKVLDIFRETKRVLSPGGILFILGTKVTPLLADKLEEIGFGRVQDDIWRRVA